MHQIMESAMGTSGKGCATWPRAVEPAGRRSARVTRDPTYQICQAGADSRRDDWHGPRPARPPPRYVVPGRLRARAVRREGVRPVRVPAAVGRSTCDLSSERSRVTTSSPLQHSSPSVGLPVRLGVLVRGWRVLEDLRLGHAHVRVQHCVRHLRFDRIAGSETGAMHTLANLV